MTVDILAAIESEKFDQDTLGVNLQQLIEDVLRKFAEKLRVEAVKSNSVAANVQLVEAVDRANRVIEQLAAHVGLAPAASIDLQRLRVLASEGWWWRLYTPIMR